MKNLKPVMQNDIKDCGVCCMQWIFIYYGGYVSLEKLREDTLTDINGTTAYHIVNTFRKWGFDAEGIFIEGGINNNFNTLDIKFPFIAHLRMENSLEHFVVVKDIANDTLYLMDPGIGNTKMTLEKFNKLFTGYVILMHPRGSIIKMEKGITIGELFIKIMSKEKFLLGKIIFTSIIWSVTSIISSYYLKIGSNVLSNDYNLVKYIIFAFLIITLMKVFILYVREYYENHLRNLVDTYLYPEFLKHLFNLPLKSIKSRSTGEIVTRIGELSSIKSLFSEIFVSCFFDSLMMLISIVILYMINEKLFYILFIAVILYALYGIIISKIIYKKILKNIDYQTNFNSVIVENIGLLESIKNLNIVNKILAKIEKSLAKYLFNNYEFNNFFNLSNLGKNFLLEISFFLINSYGFISIYHGNLNIVDLFTFNLILSYCITPIQNIINTLPKLNYIRATFSKIMEFINIPEEEIEINNVKLKGSITFKNVNYSYNNYDNVLNNLSFQINAGEHVLLNGPSGSGKSTICKIIYKENMLSSGIVTIDNKNIADLSLSTIRKNILYVSQNEELFTGTIKENILIERTVSEKYFNEICRICELEDIVSKRKFRYDALIENSAKNISGGEKQRIILARGLLKRSNIIILDEALSEVDIELERKIIKNMQEYFQDKTIIYISHKNQKQIFKKIIELGENNGIL